MPTPVSIKGDGKRTFAYMTKRGMTAQSIQTKNPEKDIYIQERTLEECSDRNSFLKLNKERENKNKNKNKEHRQNKIEGTHRSKMKEK
jgi:hypothetical protein